MKHLGKTSTYNTQVRNPGLLEAEDRITARQAAGIGAPLWDYGVDVWHCYETMAYIDGELVTGITKLVFPVENKNIVESKSLKLYMFSLNETPFAKKRDYEKTVRDDISKAIDGKVDVKFFANNSSLYHDKRTYDYYNPLLRSNCKVTGQPDYGDLFVSGISLEDMDIDEDLAKLRTENHFHEECVELIFKTIHEQHTPATVEVYAKYTRRGGIDIWPYRSKGVIQHPLFTQVKYLTKKTFRG